MVETNVSLNVEQTRADVTTLNCSAILHIGIKWNFNCYYTNILHTHTASFNMTMQEHRYIFKLFIGLMS